MLVTFVMLQDNPSSLKGGKGSGWFAPPKGSHTGEKHRAVGSGNAKKTTETKAEGQGADVATSQLRAPHISAGDVDAYGDAPYIRPPKYEMDRFMRAKNPAEVYHVTLAEDDTVRSIARYGLVPAAQRAPGQDWEAEHSSYATYFHGHPIGAASNMDNMDNMAVTVVGRIPRTYNMAGRILPDEDVSLDSSDGLKTLRRGEAVAVIAGLEPENIAGFVIPSAAGIRQSTIDEVKAAGYSVWESMENAGPQTLKGGKGSGWFSPPKGAHADV